MKPSDRNQGPSLRLEITLNELDALHRILGKLTKEQASAAEVDYEYAMRLYMRIEDEWKHWFRPISTF